MSSLWLSEPEPENKKNTHQKAVQWGRVVIKCVPVFEEAIKTNEKQREGEGEKDRKKGGGHVSTGRRGISFLSLSPLV